MSKPSLGRRTRRRALASLTAGVLATGAFASLPAAQAADPQSDLIRTDAARDASFEAGRYVVLLREDSATRYEGGTRGLRATSSDAGTFNARSAKVREYQDYLRGQQRKVAGAVGAEITRHYTLASNGFVADLSGEQAQQLSASKQVLMLTEDTAFDVDTWNTPDFLGLSGENGAWAQAGGQASAGDGVVVGVLDTGIWPESKSFAGAKLKSEPVGPWGLRRSGSTVTMKKADGGTFTGACETGEQWTVNHCNTKLVGARYYPDAFLASVPKPERSPHEFISTRDGDGHGSHTASTAAGNSGVDVTVEDTEFGAVSGMAPAAKVAAYKVCFEDNDPDTGGCYTSATLAAVEDTIADNVDVVNYSISGATSTVVDAVEYAFEGAAEAGIFVAASAGNSGPGASTVAHNSPWVTTVGASTHTVFENTAVLGDGTKLKGASIARTLPTGEQPLVGAVASKNASADPAQAALCYGGTLDPAKVAGTVVVCDRGVIDRVAKSAEVARAGGVGMILANVSPGSLDSDFHSVPTVHVAHTDTPTVKGYLDSAGASATVSFERGDTTGGDPTPVPQMAGFSSRGPALANSSDVIKPDITAPGVSVLAAVAPPSGQGRSYDLYSGTSMSSPHVAGLAAFMLGEKPEWTPMQAKSAMMTTAYDVKDADGNADTDPFGQGAGHVDPTKFFDPGLVVTSDAEDWRGFLQGQGLDLGVEPLAASDLNGPSIAQGQVTSSTTITRTFTALEAGSWSISADVPGFAVTHKSSFEMKEAGANEVVDFTFKRTDAPLGEFATGFVTLTEATSGKQVRMPVALRPVSVSAPETVRGEGASGSVEVPITAGFTGDLDIETAGLAAAETALGTVPTGESVEYTIKVGEGTKLARFDLDSANDQADMDLYVYRINAAGTALEALVGQSATGAADESVDLVNPRAASYYVVVDGYAAAPGESAMDYRLDVFRVDGTSDAGNLTATPNPVPVVENVDTSYTASWSDVDPGTRYLGWFEYDGALTPTYLYVN